jgi:hypothetical protein
VGVCVSEKYKENFSGLQAVYTNHSGALQYIFLLTVVSPIKSRQIRWEGNGV